MRNTLVSGARPRRALGLCVCMAASISIAVKTSPVRAADPPIAFTNVRIIPVAGADIPNGVLVIQAGKITAVGPASAVQVPGDAVRRDLGGKTIMPGLVDTHSHVGGASGADASNTIQPDVRVYDALDVRDAGLQKARAGGITTVNVMPGSGFLLSGQTVYLKLRAGNSIDDLAYLRPDGQPDGGMKMANGTNSLRPNGTPGTRAKSAALVREQFARAREYREKIARAGGDQEKMPVRDLALEGLTEVLDGKRVVHFHSHRHDDILTAIRLSKEFGFRMVLHHVSEGWRVAAEIAEARIPCSIINVDSPGGKLEAVNATFSTGAALDKAGVLVGFHTDDSVTDSRLFLRSAALAVRAGMPRRKALEALTIAGARMLDLDRRAGSLEPGKDADFIVLSGDPLSVYTKVLETWVEGVRVFDRADPKDRLYAVGGFGASHDQTMHVDEHGDE